ncbi:cysteine--tRNA ligase [Phyllobacterium salinisoli]|uniref:Cysteine--tRNA ligase n=1 Tax=Phyllobacterium salinisoli TaxID=1899321 RepID=A0A368K1D1_9HYPH|nr:cysteine--tRNA ligase [Phyllobacterium salinisoli]RCS23198.1 cysteine--tRNA ligase [Phyllobacterium salinisoli]
MSENAPRLRLYNTLTHQKEDFVPIDRDNVRMYVCGPTVYDFAHIGNARPVIVFDVLFRLLRHIYGEEHVTYARNITDVDDKINARAARDYPGLPLNEAIRKVTEATNDQFQADVAALGCLEPTHQPRATEHLDGMRAMIDRLVRRGFAYVADDHVLFSVASMTGANGLPRYGALARRSLDEMIAGARVDVASYKRDEMDFVLWKPSKDGEPGWPSPAGITVPGRPGWHIECSAMSMAKLLEPFGGGLECDDPEKNVFDIHAGGIDLVFPHHENEIAQSCCAFGSARMANIWMHNGFLQVEGQKMSKSLGNLVTINELLTTEKFGGRKWPGEVLRLAMLMTHYRQPIDFGVERLEEAEKILLRWADLRKIAENADWKVVANRMAEPLPTQAFKDALSDDLNTAAAFTELHRLAKEASSGNRDALFELVSGWSILGFDLEDFVALDDMAAVLSAAEGEKIEAAIARRRSCIDEKNWTEADRIRDELAAQGIQLKDSKDPVTGERVTTWEVKR